MRKRLTAATLLTLLAGTVLHAANLDLTPLHRRVSFNFGNPGARSLGMGGAFIGRADDASAAEANPAGLTVISRPEITLEVRQFEYGQDVPFGVLNTPSAGTLSVENSTTAPTFLSLAFPVGSAVLAGYYHRQLDYEQEATLDHPLGAAGPFGFYGDAPGDFMLDYRSDVYGFAGAWRAGGLSLGASARYERFEPRSTFAVYGVNLVGGVPTRTGSPVSFGRMEGSDSQFSYVAGLKWANESENVSLGFVYKSGADFSAVECNPGSLGDGCSASNGEIESTFELPSQYGAGISFRPMPGLTVNADVVRIEYSRMLRNFTPGVFCAVGECGQAESLGFDINDATEVHVGAEWAFPSARVPFAIRAGAWRDPAHAVEYHGGASSSDPLVRQAQLYASQSFSGTETENHFSIGVGYLGSKIEINAAYDHSSLSKTASISALKRF